MNKSTKIIIGVVVVAIIIVIVALTGKPKQSDTIKVGVIAPLTGTAASYGVEGRNSLVLAFDEINAAGGIGGKMIDYTIEDGKCDAPTTVSAWNKLVSIDNVSAVFGGGCSTETLTLAPLTARDHVPAFAVFSTAPKVANEGEWVFRHISTNEYYGNILAQQAYKKGYRSVALLTELKDFPVTYSDAFIKAFKAAGGTIVLDERFDPSTKDYRAEALKLKGLKYDAIFVSSQGSDVMGLVTLAIKDLGLEKPFIYNHGFAPAPFLKASKGYMPDSPLIVTPYSDKQSPKVMAFDQAYKAKYGSLYNFSTFFVTADYDMVHRFADAAAACLKGAGYSADCVRAQFQNATSYSGVAGDVTISSQYSPHGVLTPVGLLKVTADGSQSLAPIQ